MLRFYSLKMLYLILLIFYSAKQKARIPFHNVGHHRALGSLAAMLSAVGSWECAQE